MGTLFCLATGRAAAFDLFKEIVPATGQQPHPHSPVGKAAFLSIGIEVTCNH